MKKAIRRYAEFEMNDCQKNELSLTEQVAFHRPNDEVDHLGGARRTSPRIWSGRR